MSKQTWTWTAQKERAAQLLAQGDTAHANVAKQLGIAKSTLYLWKEEPEFKQRIEQNIEELTERIKEDSYQDFKAKTNWRDPLLNNLIEIVTSFTLEDLETLKKNPVTAINLVLRLQNAVDAIERRREQYEEDDFPFNPDISPEAAARIMEVIERVKAR